MDRPVEVEKIVEKIVEKVVYRVSLQHYICMSFLPVYIGLYVYRASLRYVVHMSVCLFIHVSVCVPCCISYWNIHNIGIFIPFMYVCVCKYIYMYVRIYTYYYTVSPRSHRISSHTHVCLCVCTYTFIRVLCGLVCSIKKTVKKAACRIYFHACTCYTQTYMHAYIHTYICLNVIHVGFLCAYTHGSFFFIG
jgi:hypothetical protein